MKKEGDVSYKPSKEWAEKFLPGVKELQEDYGKKDMNLTGNAADTGKAYCPLCATAKEQCSICPWFVFEGRSCMRREDRYFTQTIRQRLIRLSRWERDMEEIIKS